MFFGVSIIRKALEEIIIQNIADFLQHIGVNPLAAKELVDIAIKEYADAIVHGCTGMGNDQVRFELTIKRFAPEMKVIAPWREWNIKSREEEIEYAEKHNVPLKINK